MTQKQIMKQELKKLAKAGDNMFVEINDPAIDTIRGDFTLGPLLNLIADSLKD